MEIILFKAGHFLWVFSRLRLTAEKDMEIIVRGEPRLASCE